MQVFKRVRGGAGWIPERIVKGDAVDYILVSFERVEFFAGVCVPDPACSIVRASDEPSQGEERRE